jgi:hypothetical protein
MNKGNPQPVDARLSALLRESRPRAELPPAFQNNVWRRIEKGEQPSVSILERLAQWLVTPRLAMAAAAVVILLAAGAGALHGMHAGEHEARDRYVASVDPAYTLR